MGQARYTKFMTLPTSLVERVSRFTVILKNPNKRTKPVMVKIMSAIKDLPLVGRRPALGLWVGERRQLLQAGVLFKQPLL